MRVALICVAIGLSLGIAIPARAGEQPVVVELYTSQGCSSCPKADALLADLSGRDDVLPLALHVGYWDYIGWADTFADPRFMRRQKGYAKAAGERMIYTPQIIVGGRYRIVGSHPKQLAAAIRELDAKPDAVEVEASRQGERIMIRASMAEGATAGKMLVQVVPFAPRQRVAIRSGENAGAVIDYTHVVTDWQVLGEWDGTADWQGEARMDGPVAVLVQAAGFGPILGAARVD